MTVNQMMVLLDIFRGSLRIDRHPESVHEDICFLQGNKLVKSGQVTDKGRVFIEQILESDEMGCDTELPLVADVRERTRMMLKYLTSDAPAQITLNELWAILCKYKRIKHTLETAIASMDKTRNILTSNNPRPECNWGMLDTAALKRQIQ